MNNTVSFKTCLTYGENATYTHMQDSHHEHASSYSLVSILSKNKRKI